MFEERKLKSLIVPLMFSLLACGLVHAEQSAQDPCHVLASKQCVNLEGKWYVDEGKGVSPDVLEIAAKNRGWFSFMLEVVRGGSMTHIEGEFQVKGDIGLYMGPSEAEKGKLCALVFLPLSPTKIQVTSFGECEEGHGAHPDGIYTKANRTK